MDFFSIIAILMTVTALLAYINTRWIGLPTTIGLMLIAMLLSLSLIGLDYLGGFRGISIRAPAQAFLKEIDFNQALMHGMLSFLLFAGALHVNLSDLSRQKWVVGLMATVGVLLGTILVGVMIWYASGWLQLGLGFLTCMIFGALISPTDPIAVLGILKSAGAPKSLETKIAGESLFNDGVAVVVFLVLIGIAEQGRVTTGSVAVLFLQEAGGGVMFGLVIGWLCYYLLKSIDNYQVEVMITLSLVSGGYALAHAIHVSGPIAVVVAGLLIGGYARHMAMSERTRQNLFLFWELLDEILNAILFVLLGLEVLILTHHNNHMALALIAIPVVLLARFVSVSIPVGLLKFTHTFSPHAIRIMTWGGLKGGISVALALSLPAGEERNLILYITYAVVVFSILVQGLTIGKLVEKSNIHAQGER